MRKPAVCWLVGAALAVGLAACDRDAGAPPRPSPPTAAHTLGPKQPQVLARVGEETITDTDIGFRIRVEHLYGGSLGKSEAAVGLIKELLEYAVAQQAGAAPTKKELAQFARQVTRQSKAPELLGRIKQVFGGETADYLRLYLRPILVNIKLHDWFNRSESIHAQERAIMQQAHALLSRGQSMKSVAEKLKLRHARRTYPTGKKPTPEALRRFFPEGMPMMTDAFRKVLDGLKPGQISGTILEDESGFRIVRLLSRSREAYETEEVAMPKKDFNTWFWKQASKIPIRIPDEQLRRRVHDLDPQLNPSA